MAGQDGSPANEFHTLELTSGVSLFADISPNTYWQSHGASDEPTWGSVFAYSADGHVINFYLSDRVDLYTEELDVIARTTLIDRK